MSREDRLGRRAGFPCPPSEEDRQRALGGDRALYSVRRNAGPSGSACRLAGSQLALRGRPGAGNARPPPAPGPDSRPASVRSESLLQRCGAGPVREDFRGPQAAFLRADQHGPFRSGSRAGSRSSPPRAGCDGCCAARAKPYRDRRGGRRRAERRPSRLVTLPPVGGGRTRPGGGATFGPREPRTGPAWARRPVAKAEDAISAVLRGGAGRGGELGLAARAPLPAALVDRPGPAVGAVGRALSVAFTYVGPRSLLDPIFNKFEAASHRGSCGPDGAHRGSPSARTSDVGEVYRVDASRRTTGINAYRQTASAIQKRVCPVRQPDRPLHPPRSGRLGRSAQRARPRAPTGTCRAALLWLGDRRAPRRRWLVQRARRAPSRAGRDAPPGAVADAQRARALPAMALSLGPPWSFAGSVAGK